MMFIAEAFAAWLVEQIADAGRKRLGEWLHGSDQQRALQEAATAAILATAQQVRPERAAADDPQGAHHLARVIDQVFQQTPTPDEWLANRATLLQGLEAAVSAQLAILGDANITGMGQSSAEVLGVSAAALAVLLTGHLVREILTRGASGGPLMPLADQLNHDLTHLQGQKHSADLARLTKDLQLVLEIVHQPGPETPSILTRTISPQGRRMHELTDPFALEVHRAIDGPSGTPMLAVLPVYVERAHDGQLRAIVKRAAAGRSVAAVLVGGSSTGKTRACWEAVQALPDDWQLWHPIDPSRPEAAADAIKTVGPRTVIWLNEAQHYLLTPASDLGERVAAGLRELLRNPTRGPVLLLGTIWPEYWATLTTRPPPEQQDDPHAQARALLTGTDIAIPDAFSGHTFQALEAAAHADPRLAEAVRHAEDGRITQFLAGGPALLERYRNAPAAAKALIEAAMDARRLGHSLYLPHGLLEAAAPGYLTDQQWDELTEDWLEQALAYCASPCRGARGPLTRVRPRPAQPTPTQPRYRLADYLEQTGRSIRRIVLAPAALWDALVEHADDQDLLRIAEEAERRGLYRHAFRLYQRAAEAGDAFALGRAARLLTKAHRMDEAMGLYERAAEVGDRDALRQVVEFLQQAGRIDEAIDWYQRAAQTGQPLPLRLAAELLAKAGHVDEAIGLYERAAQAGDRNALRQAAWLLEGDGRLDEALDWYQRAAEGGDPNTLRQAAELLQQAGRIDEAIDWYQRAAQAGDPLALGRAARWLERAGRIDEAIDWLQRRVTETADRDALRQVAQLLELAGRFDEAIDWLKTRVTETSDSYALHQAARLLEEAGRFDEAIDWLQRRVTETGDRLALSWLAWLLTKVHRIDEAIGTYERAAQHGDRNALRQAARLLEDAGRRDEAINWYQRAAQAGDRNALGWAAELLAKAGRLDEAIDWYRRAVVTDDIGVLLKMAELLEQAGRLDEAIEWIQRAAQHGDRNAWRVAARLLAKAGRIGEVIGLYERATGVGDRGTQRQAAELLEQAGRLDEAIDWIQRAAQAGDRNALGWAAELLAKAGRLDEAIDWYRRAVVTDDIGVLLKMAELLEQAGRLDEAIEWYQRAAQAGDVYALRQAAELLQRANRIDETTSLYLHAAAAGDPHALGLAAELLDRIGRVDEAWQLRQYGLEPGGHVASDWH